MNIPITGDEHNITYAHEGDAGADLRSVEDTIITPNSRILVHTGLHMAIPAGYVGMVCPRSGSALKQGVTVLNAPGIVDSGYRGEVGVILLNTSEQTVTVRKGDRIAQMVFVPYAHMAFEHAESLPETDRGEGGFGSTGKE